MPKAFLNLGGGLLIAAQVVFGPPVVAQDNTVVTPLLPMNRPPGETVFQDGMNVAPLARATIFVRDIKESLKLYRDILGLKPMFDNYWKGSGIKRHHGYGWIGTPRYGADGRCVRSGQSRYLSAP